MPDRWHKLPGSHGGSLPLLLYRFITTSQDYQLYLTDLTHIWYERLGHGQILQKAEEKETSIDPSEDANQFAVFLQKIRDALEGVGSSGVDVASGKSDRLEITTTTELPGGLNSLQWTFALSKEPPSEVTQHLLLPLLRSEQGHRRRERELLDYLAEKDKVLSKIFDKIDASQLTDIFPSIASSRNAKLKTSGLLKYIKGASRFDESEWQKTFAAEESDTVAAEDIADLASGILKASASKDTHPRAEAWWHTLDENEQDIRRPSTKRKPPVQTNPVVSESVKAKGEALGMDGSTDDEGKFQRQKTPPHLKHDKGEISEKIAADDYGTTESDEEAEPASKSKSTQPHTRPEQQKPKGLGKIGGSRAIPKASQRPPSSTASTASSDALQPTHAEQATESDSPSPQRRSVIPPPSSTQHEKPVAAPKRKGGLGKIGGKKPEPEPVKEEPSQPASPPLEKPTSTQPTKKLGTIGSKKAAPTIDLPSRDTGTVRGGGMTASEDDSDDLDSGPTKLAQPGPPTSNESPPPVLKRPSSEPEEELSAQQKADKKREDLKRQMNAMSKAPQKKKRRF
ncbi:uncharacterized protein TRUGW13939_00623 [Talaromyces rugulosus]|uniref:Non-homologous end-joining factor 1 n=1 Tax=Talaromyces rugulosus TaxID=121627 RepID=A0A7H8QHU4_TALRU|nr:uncharacterized protein TRUGW13939_00623 [Talaromyces rugulosus]QKX53544.1 hypothetical protein TRUGW13939_00623 [Talaromyces rugulosus]